MTYPKWWKNLWEPPRYTGFKICSILLALLIWAYIMINEYPVTETSFTVPVEMRNLSSELAIPDVTRQVTVRVQADSSVIKDLSRSSLTAYVDFSGVTTGEATLPVKCELPENVTFVSVSPETLTFTLEELVSREFTVEAQIVGQPAEDHSLLDPVLDPTVITLYGSEANLAQVARVAVTANVDGLQENFSQRLTVDVFTDNGVNISDLFDYSPETVAMLVPVIYSQPEKSLAVTANLVGTPALGYQVSRVIVEPSTVRAFGDFDLLESLYYLSTEAIDISGLKKNATYTASIEHSPNITLAQETVTIVVQVEPVDTAEYTKNIIYVQNLADGFECTPPAVNLNILVSGPTNSVDTVEADIVPYVDAAAVAAPGEYELPVRVELPAKINLMSVTPATVTVTVTGPAPEEGGGEPETESAVRSE